MEIRTLKEELHHQEFQLCKTRPTYRQGRRLTAVKAYTVNNESQHLFIYGVPQVNLRSELKTLCRKYGNVLSVHIVTEYKTEAFTECYHVQYERIQSARIAKRFLDTKSFYGGILHVCYVPEYEKVTETRTKLMQRCKDVLSRIGYGGNYHTPYRKFKRKRDEEDVECVENTMTDPNYQDITVNSLEVIENCESGSTYTTEEELNNSIPIKNSENKRHQGKKVGLVPLSVLRAALNKPDCKRIVFRNRDNKN